MLIEHGYHRHGDSKRLIDLLVDSEFHEPPVTSVLQQQGELLRLHPRFPHCLLAIGTEKDGLPTSKPHLDELDVSL